MKSARLSRAVCGHYCRYYKPENKEDLACRGFMLIERLLEVGHPAVSSVLAGSSGDVADSGLPGRTTVAVLLDQLCPGCPFYESDCDFIDLQRGRQSEDQKSGPIPCGGFLFLGMLLERGIIDGTDINEAL